MSPELKQFYRDVKAAIEGDASKQHYIHYSDHYGNPRVRALCGAWDEWLQYNNVPPAERLDFVMEQIDLFIDAGLYYLYPFNNTAWEYNEEYDKGTLYLNPKRLAWVMEHAA